MKHYDRFTYTFVILLTLFLIVSCQQKKEQPEYTPWGSLIGEDNSITDTSSSKDGDFSLEDIVSQGEMIILTTSGPETYYDYHGHGMGMHYLLCSKFAEQLGVKLRVEVCKDTTEMLSRLNNGDADIIAYPMKSESPDSCGPGWIARNKELADTIRHWYKPSMPIEIKATEKHLLATGGVVRHVYAPMINRQKGLISKYDDLFMRYAPLAGLDWRLIAAQCYQESCFDPNAHSWAGACGLMQIMPSTGRSLGLDESSMYNPELNVQAACKAMGNLMSKFNDIPDQMQRIAFALASYNAGRGHILDAMALTQKYGKNPHKWSDVQEFILKLSDSTYYNDPVVKHGYMRGTETSGYVRRIMQRWGEYGGNVTSFFVQ